MLEATTLPNPTQPLPQFGLFYFSFQHLDSGKLSRLVAIDFVQLVMTPISLLCSFLKGGVIRFQTSDIYLSFQFKEPFLSSTG